MPIPIDWHPHIGDPTVIGWVITVAYFVVAFLSYRTGLAVKRADSGIAKTKNAVMWFGLAAMLLALGVNKQLDLQTLLIHSGRQIARSHGWYDMRREVQFYFVMGLTISGAILIGVLLWLTRGDWIAYWPLLLGVVLLVSFVLIRAASFDHVDYLLSKWRTIGPIRMKYVVELSGILILGAGAVASGGRKAGSGKLDREGCKRMIFGEEKRQPR